MKSGNTSLPTALADRVLDEIYQSIHSLARFPDQGHARPDLTSRALRFQIVRDYVIAYVPDDRRSL